MNQDRMTPEALAEIEGLAEYAIEDPDDMDRLASEAVPQMAAEIRRAWVELEKAKRDIRDMLRESRLLSDYDLCVWCERWSDPNEMCCARDCEIECKWRGLCAENGGNHEQV